MKALKKAVSTHLTTFCVLLITLLAWYSTNKSVELFNENRFQSLSSEIESDLKFRFQAYLNVLRHSQSMFLITENIDQKNFRAYIQNLKIIDQYPGILGVGFAKYIPKASLPQHLKEIRAQGQPNYRVWPEYDRPEYTSIVALEPLSDRNIKAYGYDMFSEPRRRAAMERARDTGLPSSTDKVTLVQNEGDIPTPGFLIYVAVYRSGAILKTVEDRRRQLLGYVYIPFLAEELFSALFPPASEKFPLDFEVFLGIDSEVDQLIYDHDHDPHFDQLDDRISFQNSFNIELAGKTWKIRTYSLKLLGKNSYSWIPLVVVIIGILMTLLIYIIMYNNQVYAELEHERTLELQKLNKLEKQRAGQLSTLNQAVKFISAELDLTNLSQVVAAAGKILSTLSTG